MKYLKSFENIQGISFQHWLQQGFPYDLNANFINCSHSNLTDLKGIESFKQIRVLYWRKLKNLVFNYEISPKI